MSAAASFAALSGIAPAAEAQTQPKPAAAAAQSASVIALYKKPADKAAFDAYYANHHAPLAKTLPGLQTYTISRPLTDKDPYYLVAVLTFPSMDALNAALKSSQGQAVVADLKNFAQAGVEILAIDNVPV
ncbi:MAG TPA: EthD family reductase [Candidatus Limnocylindria bacterium]|nr:EthD family reductase [Candidatus Limnocylindria bacterium]